MQTMNASPTAPAEPLSVVPGTKRQNIMLLRGDRKRNEYEQSLIERYFPTDGFDPIVCATTPDRLPEVIQLASGLWDLLLTDAMIAAEHQALLSRFVAANPRIVVGVEVDGPVPMPMRLTNVIFLQSPADLAEWRLMMEALFAEVEARQARPRGDGNEELPAALLLNPWRWK